MMRAATRDSTKVSAMQTVHLFKNSLLSYKLEAEGTDLLPPTKDRRGDNNPGRLTVYSTENSLGTVCTAHVLAAQSSHAHEDHMLVCNASIVHSGLLLLQYNRHDRSLDQMLRTHLPCLHPDLA